MTPDQQREQWAQFQAWQQAQAQQSAPARRAVNVAAIVSLVAGLLSLLVLPIVLGPVAVVSGLVGVTVAQRTGGPGGRMSSAGIVLGGLALLMVLDRMGAL